MMRVSWPARCRSPESCDTPRLSPVKSFISATRAICDLRRSRPARPGHATQTRTDPGWYRAPPRGCTNEPIGGLCSGAPSSMAGPRMALAELDGPGARAPRGSRARLAWALLPPAAAAFTFFPVTRNYFVGDDFLHLLTFANDGLLRFLVTPFGGHVLVVRNLAFALCVRAFGTDPTGFFWTVLATHVVNAGLLY